MKSTVMLMKLKDTDGIAGIGAVGPVRSVVVWTL